MAIVGVQLLHIIELLLCGGIGLGAWDRRLNLFHFCYCQEFIVLLL